MNAIKGGYSAQSQSIGLVGVGNARELGGYRTPDGRMVRRGAILRTAAPEGATDEDRRRLEHDYRLTCVLDFRMNMEFQVPIHPVGGFDFATTHRVPILDEDYYLSLFGDVPMEEIQKMSPIQMIVEAINLGLIDENMYIGFLEGDCGKRGFAEVFSYLLAQPQEEALLFHCAQGKDRTGLAAMLILSALGVDEQTIVFDYLLTNTFNATIIERERKMLLSSGIPEDRLEAYMLGFDQVFPQTMQNALEHLKSAYGSVWGYVRGELGVSDADCEDLCAKYLV